MCYKCYKSTGTMYNIFTLAGSISTLMSDHSENVMIYKKKSFQHLSLTLEIGITIGGQNITDKFIK